MARPEGSCYEHVGDEIRISHHGRLATTLRGEAMRRFLADVDEGDAEELMARATGNYKRGNERTAAQHPRQLRR